jgi:hypothetical protein
MVAPGSRVERELCVGRLGPVESGRDGGTEVLGTVARVGVQACAVVCCMPAPVARAAGGRGVAEGSGSGGGGRSSSRSGGVEAARRQGRSWREMTGAAVARRQRRATTMRQHVGDMLRAALLHGGAWMAIWPSGCCTAAAYSGVAWLPTTGVYCKALAGSCC